MTDLIPIEQIDSLVIFQEGGLNPLLEQIKKEALSVVHDVETTEGRKDIASTAYKIAQTKTVIDAAGKDLVSEWKDKAKVVDAARKHARDFLDGLKAEIRWPLTAWQAVEDQKKADQLAAMEVEASHINALAMDDLFNREAEVKRKEAAMQAEEAKRQQEAREARIATDAAQAEKDKAENALLAAERREIELKRKAEKDKTAAVEAERIRVQREAQEVHDAAIRKQERKKAEDDARKANVAHQRAINKAAFTELSKRLSKHLREWESNKTEQYGPDDVARATVIMIAKGEIPGIRMVY